MKPFLSFAFTLFSITLTAQKRLTSLPIELVSRYSHAYILDNQPDAVALVLKDNKQAKYVLFDKSAAVKSKFDQEGKSEWSEKEVPLYRGGTVQGNIFRFVYENKVKKASVFQVETVDFGNKTVKYEQLFEVPQNEKLLTSLYDNNAFYAVTVDDDKSELGISAFKEGSFKQQHFSFKVPQGSGKGRSKLSDYFDNLEAFRPKE